MCSAKMLGYMGGNMSRSRAAISYWAFCCAWGLTSAGVAVAQGADETEDAVARQKTVVVTAQKREEAITDVPMSLQAFGGELLEDTGLRDINDIIRTIPGASEGFSASEGQKQYQVRGVSTPAGDSTVGYYIDDAAFSIPNNQYAPLARTFDVDRVEVIRGPQGTLYGQGSMGGTIRFITADPDLDTFALKGQVGAYDADGGEMSYYGDAAVNLPLITDKLGVRLVVGQEEKGGYVDISQFVPGEDVNDATISNVRAKVLFTPNEKVTLKGLYQNSKTDQDFSAAVSTTAPPTVISTGRPAFLNNEMEQFSGFVGIDLGFAKLENSIGQIDYQSDQDFEVPLLFFGPGTTPVPLPYIINIDAATFSNELRLVSNEESIFNWIVGAYYQESRRDQVLEVGGLLPAALSQIDQESISVFGEVSWSLMDGKLTPLIGLRYFTDDRDFDDDSATPAVAADDTIISDTFESVNPRFNLSYAPDDDSLYYINVAKGFRSGTFNSSSSVGFGQLFGLPVGFTVEPDELWTYETGTKLVRGSGNLVLEGSVYYTDWKDIQTLVNPGVVVLVNGGQAEIYGLDYSVSYFPTDGLTLQLSGNVNTAEFKSIPASIRDAVPGDLFENGQRIPFVPPYNVTASVTYEWPVGQSGLRGYAYGSFTETGAQFANEIEGDKQSLLAGRVGVQNDSWGLFVFANNLLDEDGAIYNQASPLLSTQTRTYPRTVGVELKFDF